MLAKHGNEDRVAILYNLDTLDLQQTFELIRFPGSRKALVGEFVHKASGIEFLFMVNHFNRRDTDRRRRQARLIRDWVLDHDLPAVLTGDHNFDFNPETLRGNRAFEIFTADQRLRWLRPKCLAARTCPPTGTQCDNRYNSIMDFVLIADRARGWRGMAEVLLKRPDYCERERRGYADHYPVRGVIEIR